MTKTIWKYPLEESLGIETALEMPLGSNVVRVGMQGKHICLWACVVPDGTEKEVRSFLVSGTGHPVPMKASYVGSVSQPVPNSEFQFEWHVWEL